MSSAVARPIRSSSKKLTSSTVVLLESRALRTASWSGPLARAARSRGQVDTELLRRAEDVLVGLAHLDGHAVAGEHLDVQAQRLHLLDEHLEGLGDAGLGDVLALDDGLVDLHPAEDVVGLDRRAAPAARRRRRRPPGPSTSISPKRWPPNCALPPSGCWVIIEYGPVERAWILSSTRWQQLEDVDVADRDRVGNGSPERPSKSWPCRSAGPCATPSRLVRVLLEQADDLLLVGTVEDRGGDRWCRLDRGQLLSRSRSAHASSMP